MTHEVHEPVSAAPAAADTTPAEELAGVSDGFERLWTPHRMAYINGERPTDDAGDGCPFCAAPTKDDAEGLVVHRGEHCYVVMNLFPYNPGHLLVCPYRHVSLYVELTDEETAEFTALTKAAIAALDAVLGAGRLQHRHEPGRRRRRRRQGAPAPARRPALGRRLQLPAGHRPDEGAADAAGGRPPPAGRGLADATERSCLAVTRGAGGGASVRQVGLGQVGGHLLVADPLAGEACRCRARPSAGRWRSG